MSFNIFLHEHVVIMATDNLARGFQQPLWQVHPASIESLRFQGALGLAESVVDWFRYTVGLGRLSKSRLDANFYSSALR